MNTPTTKRPLSEGSTPSPSLRKELKIPKMAESEDRNKLNIAAGTTLSQVKPVDLVKTPEETNYSGITVLPSDPEERWNHVQKYLQSLDSEVKKLRAENSELKSGLATATGKIQYLENQLAKTKTKVGDLEWKQLQNDIVVYNLPENVDITEPEAATRAMAELLQIPQTYLHSPSNPSGSIQVGNAFRIGKKLVGKPRPLVITFISAQAKKTVIEQYRKKQNSIQIRITDHFPSEMRERRTIQKDSLKKYKEINKNTGTSVKLVKDKLIVGTKVVEDAFQKNPLATTPSSIPPPQTAIQHTPVREVNGSTFQGHAVQISSFRDAALARESLFQLPSVAQSDHLIYAYNIIDPSGMKIEGNSDGGEWAASRLLVTLIEEEGLKNVFLAVTRKHAGPNLGPQRFKIISEVAADALQNTNWK